MMRFISSGTTPAGNAKMPNTKMIPNARNTLFFIVPGNTITILLLYTLKKQFQFYDFIPDQFTRDGDITYGKCLKSSGAFGRNILTECLGYYGFTQPFCAGISFLYQEGRVNPIAIILSQLILSDNAFQLPRIPTFAFRIIS